MPQHIELTQLSAQQVLSMTGQSPVKPIRIEYQWINALGLVSDHLDLSQAPLFVFLHEGLGSVAAWRTFPNQVCQALGVNGLVYSRPGYGSSSARCKGHRWRPDFMHIQGQIVLPALLAALNVPRRVFLLGHSDGGSISLLYAAALPHSVQGVVVLAPHLFVEDLSLQGIRAALQSYQSGELRAALRRYHEDVDSAFYGWSQAWLGSEFRHWNIEQDLMGLAVPVLAIQGEDDPYGTTRQIDAIAALAERVDILAIPNCGHAPHVQQKDRVRALAILV